MGTAIDVKGLCKKERQIFINLYFIYFIGLFVRCRYLQPPNTWMAAKLESRELLSIILKRLKGISKVRLIDAGFVWTEPHSMRIKVKLTIQKEVGTQ
jgi:NMD protein affecting ribosome stability and mRNA decay